MIIDSHQHFWNYEPQKHSWIDEEMKSIRRDFLPEELAQVYKENEITGSVVVEADQAETETAFLLSLSKQHPFIKGVVGFVDLKADNIILTA